MSVFCRFWQFCAIHDLLIVVNLEISRFSVDNNNNNDSDRSITLSFAHAHGVNIVLYCLAVIKVHDVCTYKHPSHVHTYHHSALVWVTDAHWAHHISVTAVQSTTLNKLINGSLHVALLRIFVLYITGVSVKVYKMRISTAVIIYGSAFCLPLSHYHQ